MVALAYLLPPLSGLVSYLGGSTHRARWHGLQSVLLGLLWPGAMYLGSLLSPAASQLAALAGACAWIAFIAGTALGADPRWPGVGARLRALAAPAPR
jgi:hypothetical protein